MSVLNSDLGLLANPASVLFSVSAYALTINKTPFTAFYESVSVLPYRSNKLLSPITSPHSAGSYTAFSMLRAARFSFAVRASNAFIDNTRLSESSPVHSLRTSWFDALLSDISLLVGSTD